MKFTDIFIRRPVLAVSISLLIVILGLQAIAKLTVREYPKMTTTVINVTTAYPGADANLIQAFITSKLEEAIAQADNIDYMSSSSSPSTSSITVKMKLNTDPNAALADVLAKVNSVRSALPSGIDDPTITSSSGGSGIMYISFRSNKLDASQVTDYIERVVKPQFFTIEGVAKVTIYGASQYAMRIWLDPQKMASQNLSAPEVMAALSANNAQTAAGNDNGYFTVYKNKVETTTKTVEQLRNLIVYSQGDNLVRLRDIADVELDKESDNSRAVANGSDSVVLAIDPASTANPLTVAENIRPLYESIKRNLPDSIETDILYDRTIAINSSIDEVIKTILEATVIVLVVITLFIGSLRAILIPIITIPISLIGVIMMLQTFDFSINLMTLLALILAIGLVVDDAIVVLENVDRHIKLGETPFRAAIIGTREIAVPVISMTIALIAVYSPMALMNGITGSLFKEFALTLAGAVFISGIVALTLSPMMSSKLLKAHTAPSKFEQKIDRTLTKLTNAYGYALGLVMNSRKSVLAFAVVIFATVPMLFNSLSSELTPAEDKGAFLALGNAPSNVNVDYVQDAMKGYEQILKETPEVAFSMVISGAPSSNQSLNVITLKDWNDRSRKQSEVLADLNKKAQAIPEVSVSGFAFPEIDTGEQGPPVSFVISTAKGYDELAQIAGSFLDKMKNSGLFVYTTLDLKFDTPQMNITIDKEKAGTYGVSMQQISSTLGSYLSAATITRVDIDGRAYKVISEVKRKDRLSPESLDNYYVKASNGESVPLSSFLTIKLESQPSSLPRFSQLNSAIIGAVPSPTSSIGDAVKWLKDTAATDLPQGYNYDFKGEARQLEQEGNALAVTFALAVIIIFLVLAIQFESIRDPMVIMISVPLAVSGALFALNLFAALGFAGTTLNIYSQVGLITLVGLITKHGILMCEVAKEEQLNHHKNRIDAIMSAAKVRLRPILMTTAAMIAGLIPLLYATGAGAVSRFSIGIVIVAGLAIGTLFTLFVLPVIYSYIASEHKPLPEFDENIKPIGK
ncbi:multidrug efflux RND transporter permease subunit AcrB [Avibacterium paragallinarum]|uniref:multidrug efflux RND transporter permease subunit AcrB n=1 Tax=Avibacterium paragallinarum TaxID=728 RepID=UPI00021ACC15|nr:efflux RND transporter permease subunit [Avibacterium paragallinarum]AZI14846.1 efflux RND transporter permease subunit [Avibacterium paragallinarum]QIR12281.1 efflux RND transporter permease subunit [Avibacterium paragallinarum]QJE08895.1 efflux RND transporter permease subunit [Avibacterium paragallinarum]QJE11092.1 efflux RND transporter permease subunit [Avibacterium paragallinarum]QJE13288.1 efflux RND transporter permease subunit [Avibacterium paragallinarum]